FASGAPGHEFARDLRGVLRPRRGGGLGASGRRWSRAYQEIGERDPLSAAEWTPHRDRNQRRFDDAATAVFERDAKNQERAAAERGSRGARPREGQPHVVRLDELGRRSRAPNEQAAGLNQARRLGFSFRLE